MDYNSSSHCEKSPAVEGIQKEHRREHKEVSPVVYAAVYTAFVLLTEGLERTEKKYAYVIGQEIYHCQKHYLRLADYAREKDVHVVLRVLRALTDFEYELHMAQTNYLISGGWLETVFLSTDLEYSYLSSTTVREIASFHGDVSKFVPECVAESLYKKFGY